MREWTIREKLCDLHVRSSVLLSVGRGHHSPLLAGSHRPAAGHCISETYDACVQQDKSVTLQNAMNQDAGYHVYKQVPDSGAACC